MKAESRQYQCRRGRKKAWHGFFYTSFFRNRSRKAQREKRKRVGNGIARYKIHTKHLKTPRAYSKIYLSGGGFCEEQGTKRKEYFVDSYSGFLQRSSGAKIPLPAVRGIFRGVRGVQK
ncbi:MAG TPA: hypothetical protein DEV98_00940 [Clostridiales bacterium]|nr:hypothetical protein [Clostridiales bacterium]